MTKYKIDGEDNSHFYASSFCTWMVDRDPAELVRRMKTEGYPFTLWLVPLPLASGYEIFAYAPVVDGIVRLCHYATDL